MNLLKYIKNGLLLILILLSCSLIVAQNHSLTVQVTNVKEKKGNIVISIFNNVKSFLKEGEEFIKKTIPVKEHTITITFVDLPSGYYSVALYHDENGDHVCNKNILGIPKEWFGFSKNFSPLLRAPRFDEIKILLQKNDTIPIKMIRL
jgi:uncharacterized protein (DUF2141 family)